jgi:PKD repeat protein
MLILPSSVFAVTGSITGRVTNGNNGIAGVSVWVYSSDGRQVLGVYTDTNGYYTASGISSGTYKVFFLGTFVGYIDQWFSNKSNFTSADAVTVNAPDSTSGIDEVLIAGGAIVGTVTNGTTPLPNIGVWVYDNSCGVIEKTSTNYNGEYAAGGLPSGNYKVFFDSGSTGYIGEWYNDKASCVSADSVAVSAPNTTSSIDAVLIRTGGLAGRVTDGTNGIDRIVVGVYDSSCALKATAVTNLNGDYALGGLPSGNYKVFFSGGSAGFMSEWYSNQTSCAVADSVAVTDENITQNVDAVLASLYRPLTVSTMGTGSGTVVSTPPAINCGSTCSTSFILGTLVYLYANAASGSFFDSWTGACSGNASPCTINIADGNAVTASFNTYANFTADKTDGGAPLFVSFTDQSSNNPTAWSWDFGDSGASNLQNPVHKYASPGTYSVTLSNAGPSGPSSLTINNFIKVSFCENNPVRIGGFTNTYSSIQDVYNGQAVSGDVIESQALDLPGSLLFDKDKTVTLKGGFDCPFATNAGQYTTVGTITLGGLESGMGGVIIENIIAQ